MDCSKLESRLELLYQQARSFVEHEDDLVDRRLKWVITISAFLFAAYGGSFIAYSSTDKELEKNLLSVARLAMCFSGYCSSMMGARSIQAAHHAIRAITRKYNAFLYSNRNEIIEGKLQVWKLIGDRATHVPGFMSAISQPFYIAWVWIVLALAEVFILLFDYVSAKSEIGGWILFSILIAMAFYSFHRLIFTRIEKAKNIIVRAAFESSIPTEHSFTPEMLDELTEMSEHSFWITMKDEKNDP